ncbi:MAG: nuclear transport factor 2 family protein [Alphaproteobacteria bacterium]|nr:nuclear transport factor 2 family protein [Alphaproteobacteria bacterium]MBU0863762.1 nuclear transport factor 2 family protein [Alphaproteobacteria bacterium]MBU1825357.1 nuclear transport factor 2 family protein [Alphaproteobacteria bacterium]
MPDTAEQEKTLPTQALFDRYHVGWETRDPDMIASLHSDDTVFQLHDGSESVVGREPLRAHCRTLFAAYDFSQLMGRRIYGRDYWIFDWTMVLSLALPDHTSFIAHVDMVDVVKVNRAGEVVSKHVYPDAQQMTAAFAQAGIAR